MVYGFLRALLGEPGFLATVVGAKRKHRRQLGISVGMPGPHDLAVRNSVARLSDVAASIASRAPRS